MKLLAITIAVIGLSLAPFQCASEPDPDQRMEDSAPKALWQLAQEFERRGDARARRVTLQQLIEQYPKSRYARRAEGALGQASRADADASIHSDPPADSTTGARSAATRESEPAPGRSPQ